MMGKVVGGWPPHTYTHVYTIHRNTKGEAKRRKRGNMRAGAQQLCGNVRELGPKDKNSERMHYTRQHRPREHHGQDLVWFLALVFLFLRESWNVCVWWALVYPPSYIWRVRNIQLELQALNAIPAHSLHISALCLPLSRCRAGFTTSLDFAILSIWKNSLVYHLGLEISL